MACLQAKVSAVKTQRKLTTSKASKEEIEDLLDESVATPTKPKTTAAAAATKPKPPLAKVGFHYSQDRVLERQQTPQRS